MLINVKCKVRLLMMMIAFSCGVTVAQTPVCISISSATDKGFASKFKAAIEKNIALSDRFVVWNGAPFDVPKNGVLVRMYVQRLSGGTANPASAVVLQAEVPSKTERGYFMDVIAEEYTFADDAPVADEALDFLTDLRKYLPASH
jgi:hypothetical protein